MAGSICAWWRVTSDIIMFSTFLRFIHINKNIGITRGDPSHMSKSFQLIFPTVKNVFSWFPLQWKCFQLILPQWKNVFSGYSQRWQRFAADATLMRKQIISTDTPYSKKCFQMKLPTVQNVVSWYSPRWRCFSAETIDMCKYYYSPFSLLSLSCLGNSIHNHILYLTDIDALNLISFANVNVLSVF